MIMLFEARANDFLFYAVALLLPSFATERVPS